MAPLVSHAGSGSIEAHIEPLERAMSRSAPNAWIWSRFSSACSFVVVSTITRPRVSTSAAILKAVSAVWPKSRRSIAIT